jgi:hypothetical protein
LLTEPLLSNRAEALYCLMKRRMEEDGYGDAGSTLTSKSGRRRLAWIGDGTVWIQQVLMRGGGVEDEDDFLVKTGCFLRRRRVARQGSGQRRKE